MPPKPSAAEVESAQPPRRVVGLEAGQQAPGGGPFKWIQSGLRAEERHGVAAHSVFADGQSRANHSVFVRR